MARDYPPSNTKDALLLLFELAEREKRVDLIAVAAPFIELEDLAYRLDTVIRNREDDGQKNHDEVFSDVWRQALTRSQYSSKEVERLLSAKLCPLPGYLDFIEEVALKATPESRHHFIADLCSKGHHVQALTLLKSLDSLDEIRLMMHEDLRHYTRINKEMAFFRIMGNYRTWDRSTLQVLNLLGLDMPPSADLAGITGQDNTWGLWSQSRFNAQVDYVGDILLERNIGIPKVTLAGELPLVKDATLGEAFALGQTYAASLGGWHLEHFPNYYPAVAAAADIKALELHGAIALRVSADQLVEGSNGRFMAPVHAFSSVSDKTSDVEVRLAMSLLANDQIAMLRESIAPDPTMAVILVPSHFPREKADVPAELALAVQYHRPEVLKIRGQLSRRISSSLDTRLYLKGVPAAFFDINREFSSKTRELAKLDIGVELHSTPGLLKYFTGPLEREQLSQEFMKNEKRPEETKRLSVSTYDHARSDDENLAVVLDLLKTYRETLGDIQFRIVAPLHFLEFMASQKLGFTEEINYHIEGRQGYSNSLGDHPRLRASLGERHEADLSALGDTPEAWVAKAVRSQDEKIKDIAAGLLDRMDIVEVARLATTAPRMKFLASKFDFVGVSEHLPKNVLEMYISGKLEQDLGL
ncbi:hypothetical protein RBE51_18875 [Pseudomonas taiwanensis]|uniref:hypothetical protein n=1 Tax=Pseudomonas taiwanensis TaxID=470150 RepID=UPI0028DECF7A|nr:hypothetical protein [Pseudomonas taiwanensis]MDT8924853.1 hypothetical protein [Pseudomonas taiwanensis]